jgi:hypothetical protein
MGFRIHRANNDGTLPEASNESAPTIPGPLHNGRFHRLACYHHFWRFFIFKRYASPRLGTLSPRPRGIEIRFRTT